MKTEYRIYYNFGLYNVTQYSDIGGGMSNEFWLTSFPTLIEALDYINNKETHQFGVRVV